MTLLDSWQTKVNLHKWKIGHQKFTASLPVLAGCFGKSKYVLCYQQFVIVARSLPLLANWQTSGNIFCQTTLTLPQINHRLTANLWQILFANNIFVRILRIKSVNKLSDNTFSTDLGERLQRPQSLLCHRSNPRDCNVAVSLLHYQVVGMFLDSRKSKSYWTNPEFSNFSNV